MSIRVRARRILPTIALTLLACAGSQGSAQAQTEKLEELMPAGATVFTDICAACHGDVGQGTGNAPALDKNAFVESRNGVVTQILWGNQEHGMPPFADILTDQEIAAVATYVRNAWSNKYGIVFPRSVELRRTQK